MNDIKPHRPIQPHPGEPPQRIEPISSQSQDESGMKIVTLDEWHAALRGQGRTRIEDVTFRCPRCKTLQSAQDLIDAGAGSSLDDVEKYVAFSCIGRFTDAKGCDWTLGGLFQIHTLEVVTPDGVHHPRFEPATD